MAEEFRLTPEEELEEKRRNAIIRAAVDRVRAEQNITPIDAERLCDAEGIKLVAGSTTDVVGAATWPIRLGILLYTWRDINRIKSEWDRFQFWGAALQRDPASPEQFLALEKAEEAMLHDLRIGILRAFGTTAGKISLIPANEWEDLSLRSNHPAQAVRVDGLIRYSGVFVLRHEIVPLLINEAASANAARSRGGNGAAVELPSKGKGGRKPKPGMDDFWIEVVRLSLDGNIPGQEQLTRHMTTWCEQNSVDYEPDTVGKKISSLFAKLGWIDGVARD